MKKILFLTSSLGLGGIEKSLIEVVNNLDRKLYKIEVCIKNGDEIEFLSDLRNDIKITFMYSIKMMKDIEKSKNKILKKIKKYKSKKQAIKNIQDSIEKNDIIVDFYDGNFYKYLKGIKNRKRICFIHAKVDKINIYKKGKFKEALKSYDEFYAVSEELAKEVEKVSNKKCDYIYNLFDLEKIKEESLNINKLSKQEKKLIKSDFIFAASRLCDETKDFKTMIQAYKKSLELGVKENLYIAGAGPFEEELRELIVKNNLQDKIILLGFQKNPYIWMKNSKCFILTSKYEGFGMTLVEALVSGTPIISTDCPNGPKEILSNGKYGILVEVGNYKEIAKKLFLLLNDNKLRSKMIDEGYKRSIYFDLSKLNKNYKKVLK